MGEFKDRGEDILSTPAKDNVEGQHLYAQKMERLTKLKELLIQDQTGVSILRNNVELLKQGILPVSMEGVRYLPFVLAGAQLAYDLYTQVYPLSQNLPDATYHS